MEPTWGTLVQGSANILSGVQRFGRLDETARLRDLLDCGRPDSLIRAEALDVCGARRLVTLSWRERPSVYLTLQSATLLLSNGQQGVDSASRYVSIQYCMLESCQRSLPLGEGAQVCLWNGGRSGADEGDEASHGDERELHIGYAEIGQLLISIQRSLRVSR